MKHILLAKGFISDKHSICSDS